MLLDIDWFTFRDVDAFISAAHLINKAKRKNSFKHLYWRNYSSMFDQWKRLLKKVNYFDESCPCPNCKKEEPEADRIREVVIGTLTNAIKIYQKLVEEDK